MIQQCIRTVRRTARRFRERFREAPLILLYHRVTALSSDPQLLTVTPEHFEQHLDVLRRNAEPMALQDMVDAWRMNRLPRKAVAVTFDDGYADNFHLAKPILKRCGVPATVYVTSGYVDSNREFPPDELERLFLQPGALPQQLTLTVNGCTHRWDLGESAYYSEDSYRNNRAWHVLKTEDPTPRQHVYRALCQLLHTLPDAGRQSILDALTDWAGRGPSCRETHRALRTDELLNLEEQNLIEIGSHTRQHPVLSALPLADQQAEIEASKLRLETILGHPIRSFAYPYGTPSDYTAETVRLVRMAGYDHACSNFEGVLQRDTDPWQLPRFLVRDWDGEEFSRRLSLWTRL
jgi:peptidoglycan/xylan/chitin deacetylase (PgdA/CDA1 family)